LRDSWLEFLAPHNAADEALKGFPYSAGVLIVGAVITLNVALGGMKGITLVQAFQYWAKMFAISVPIFVLMTVYGHYGKQIQWNGQNVLPVVKPGAQFVSIYQPNTNSSPTPEWKLKALSVMPDSVTKRIGQRDVARLGLPGTLGTTYREPRIQLFSLLQIYGEILGKEVELAGFSRQEAIQKILPFSTNHLFGNHFLAVAIDYLYRHRPHWPASAAVGKTLVSSLMIDRVAADVGRPLVEVPVGFKWFVAGLLDGSCGFGGEESAGASFLRQDGTAWATDKDGLIMALLAAEITARTGQDPGEHYRALTREFGTSYYARIDAAATPVQKAALEKLSPDSVKDVALAGEPIVAKLTHAPGNDAPIGGLKVVAGSGWFAARPSGTENLYKVYAESFQSQAHLEAILGEAQAIVSRALQSAGV